MSVQQRIDWMLKAEADFARAFADFGPSGKVTKLYLRRLQLILEACVRAPKRYGRA